MFNLLKGKEYWPLIRAQLCTLAVSVSINSTIRIPSDSFRYGSLPYLFIYTIFSIIIAIPMTLLQLSTGQLSQQDAVGVWKAVPFFKGLGYLRLINSFIQSTYVVIYAALSTAYILYTLQSSIPFFDCREWHMYFENITNSINASYCMDITFMSSVQERPEYFSVLGIIIAIIWITTPFMLFNSVKHTKVFFCIVGPSVLVLAIVIISVIGKPSSLSYMVNGDDWLNLLEPYIWFTSLTQSLMSAHIGTGFLVSAGHTIYASTNVQWTAISFVTTNVLAAWLAVLFWYGVGSDNEKDTSILAVLIETYQAAEENNISDVWPIFIYIIIATSGIISVVTCLFPLYERFREVGGEKWRRLPIFTLILGFLSSLAILAGKQTAMTMIDQVIVPILIIVPSLLEVFALVFIYGWTALLDDIDFLTGNRLHKLWIFAWCIVPLLISPFFFWWLITIYVSTGNWSIQSSELWVTLSIAFFFVVFITFAIYTTSRQVQYDTFSKLKSAFKSSRHWGPKDPIGHYYWLARRDNTQRNNASGGLSPTAYTNWQFGQMFGTQQLNTLRPFFSNIETENWADVKKESKRRVNSDDWLYTKFRKKYLEAAFYLNRDKQKSKSLDDFPTKEPIDAFNPSSYNKDTNIEQTQIYAISTQVQTVPVAAIWRNESHSSQNSKENQTTRHEQVNMSSEIYKFETFKGSYEALTSL